ncbi:hypothetical protein [Streptomyces nanshensis]|uniref:hypothetical protein n=1 Tax=Streptomyces nanshensis TaxID=518642 RepID=UPI00085C1616|nr:hypothetical protein [Streptomyces nanshensis]
MNDTADTDAHDTQWGDRLTLFLTYRGVDAATARNCAREALAHCAESGERPEETFGDAKEYAEQLAAAHLPAAARARADHPGHLAPEDYREAPWLVPGGLLLVCGGVLWFQDGLWTTPTAAGTAQVALLVVTFVLAAWAQAFRAEGRTRAAGGALVAALAGAVLVAVAMEVLPHDGLMRIPAPLLLPAGAGLLWLGGRVGTHRAASAAATTAASTPPGTAGVRADEGREHDAEAWLRRLEGLLRGRHKVSRADARRLTAEAREHLAGTGTLPEEEFGGAEEYALRLVEEGAARRRSRESLSWNGTALLFVLVVISLVDRDGADFGWWQWCLTAAAVAMACWLILRFRARWPSRKGS